MTDNPLDSNSSNDSNDPSGRLAKLVFSPQVKQLTGILKPYVLSCCSTNIIALY